MGFGLGPGFNSRTVTSTLNVTSADGIGFESDVSDIDAYRISDMNMINNESLDESISKFAFVTNFKIGYALNEQFMVYWNNSVAWLGNNEYIVQLDSMDFYDSVFLDDGTYADDIDTVKHVYYSIGKDKEEITLALGVGGVGATYFFKPKAPSLFVNMGVGLSYRSYPFWGTEPWTGLGVSGGIGYEFSPNWNTELTFFWAAPKGDAEEEPLKYETSSIAIGLTINVLGY